jgi:tetratricopeptide (TPR) repeat protein
LISKINTKKAYILILTIGLITLIYSVRGFIRTLDWKDSFSLYYSAIETANNPLNKAFRYKGLTPQDKIHVRYPEHFVDSKYLKLAYDNLELSLKELEVKKNKYQDEIPQIIKFYGLDPESLLAKTGYYLAQTDFTLNKDYKRALSIISPYTNDLTKFDSAALSFYGALLFYNQMPDKAETVFREALRITPYSTRIIFPLCDLIYTKNKNLDEIENLTLKAFKYFPYDTYTLLAITKLYELKKEPVKFAYFSHIYGIRHHSVSDLRNAVAVFKALNKNNDAQNAEKRLNEIEKFLIQNKTRV